MVVAATKVNSLIKAGTLFGKTMLKAAEGIGGLERKEGPPVETILETIGIVSEETEKAGGIVVCGTIGSMVVVAVSEDTNLMDDEMRPDPKIAAMLRPLFG